MSELPKGWARTTLGEITTHRIDQGGPDATAHTFCYIDISAIDRETKRITNPQILPVNEAPSRARQGLQAGDVLVSMTRPNLNAVAMVPEELSASVGSTGFHVLRSGHVSPGWLRYRVQASDFVHAMSMKVQGALYPAVRPNDITQFATSIAPRNEQDRIVDEIEKQFTRLDAATAALKHVQANLKRYRASVLKAACEGRLVPAEADLARKEGRDYESADKLLQRILRERRARWEADTLNKMTAGSKRPTDDRWKQKYKDPSAPDATNLPKLPEGWCWATVEQVGFVQLGRQRAPQHHHGNNMRPYLRVANVLEDRLDITDVKTMNFTPVEFARYKLQVGDILLNEGQSFELVGRPAMFRGEVEDCCYQKTLLRFRSCPLLDGDFALTVFLSYLHNGRFQAAAKHTTNMAHLVAERFAPLEFPLPPIEEQRRIVRATRDASARIERLQHQLARSLDKNASLRRAVLSDAFSGRLVPQNHSDEPASLLLERICAERKPSARSNSGHRGSEELVHA
jgi:type I restriction enzyme S subunit